MKRAPSIIIAALLLLAGADALVAQDPPGSVLEGRTTFLESAILEGQIVDSISGDPIEGVLVRMDGGQEGFTDARGEFRFIDLEPGRRLFAILTVDCRITWAAIDVVAGIPRQARIRLPQAFGAAAAEAQREQQARRRTGGRRLEAHEIDRMGARSVTELIRRLAPQMVLGMAGEIGNSRPIVSGRGRSVDDSPPVVVVDNVRMPDPAVALEQMLPSEIDMIEVLPGAAAGWEFGSAGAGGVIRITLRRPLATGAVERPVAAECVVPQFPRR